MRLPGEGWRTVQTALFSTPPLWHPGNVCRPGCFCRGCLRCCSQPPRACPQVGFTLSEARTYLHIGLRCCSYLSLLLLAVTSNAPKLPITRVTGVLSRQLRGDIPRRGIPRTNAPRGSIQISPHVSPAHHRAHPALAPAAQLPATRSGLGIRFRHPRRRRRQSARGCLGS